MAQRHGLAGQFAKSEAAKRKWRIVMGSFGFCAYAMALFSFLAGLAWSRFGPAPALIVMVVIALLIMLAWRMMEPYFDEMNRERIKYLKGAQAEALVAWLLEELDSGWHVFNGIQLEKNSDHDHVLVGPGGLFVISTKSDRGLFVGTPDGLLRNGETCHFAKQAMAKAMQMKDRLAALMGDDVPWVQPVLALPFGFIQGDACGGKVWTVHQFDMVDRLMPHDGPRRLTKEQVKRATDALDMIQRSAATVYQRPAPAA
jgi:hypothetical protein